MESNYGPMRQRNQLLRTTTLGIAVGTVCGTAVELMKGIYNPPPNNGSSNRLIGGLKAVRVNFPSRLSGTVAAWCFIYGLSDYTLCNIQQKREIFTSWVSCGVASGIVGLRKGFIPASKMSALGLAVFPMAATVQAGYHFLTAKEGEGEGEGDIFVQE